MYHVDVALLHVAGVHLARGEVHQVQPLEVGPAHGAGGHEEPVRQAGEAGAVHVVGQAVARGQAQVQPGTAIALLLLGGQVEVTLDEDEASGAFAVGAGLENM